MVKVEDVVSLSQSQVNTMVRKLTKGHNATIRVVSDGDRIAVSTKHILTLVIVENEVSAFPFGADTEFKLQVLEAVGEILGTVRGKDERALVDTEYQSKSFVQKYQVTPASPPPNHVLRERSVCLYS